MILSLAGATAGGALGLAVALMLTSIQRWRPNLDDALWLSHERNRTVAATPLGTSLLRGLLGRLPLAVDAEDLRVLGIDRSELALRRLIEAVLGLLCGPLFLVLTVVLEVELPSILAVGFSAVGAWAGWSGAARRVRRRADARRDELRHALVTYLQQVSLLRRAGAGVVTAFRGPAELLTSTWAFATIGHHLELAERAGKMPWDGLRRLSEDVDLPELDDISAIARSAGSDGGTVIETLLARADSLEDELRSEAHAAANRASVRMNIPGAVQVLLITAWVLVPATSFLMSL
ncbi:Type II secretion system (T2SS), protein F [Pseudonocardia oroxyli]|uniref:Type II secretion system (T2SS), protein F n=2 Tax=Pseudonocardia oroxyli TaxID=366584 RepID=A0A1G7WZC9_PSEOR|nr:Type II secretion system (T2SS), protein F [Pseudonocardia oroxyli]